MAYFECVIGSVASGGSGADLIVSCTSGFAGSVITCTNGTDTFTQTCPSTSPYEVTFESIPTGTWTISGVSGGQTFTQSVTITDFTASLNDIPDGATVTPVNDIQIWLHCANIWDKSYTTISQVLSDTSTLLALISSNNASDYMARSTSWASSVCANQTAMGYIGNNDYCAEALLNDSTWLTAICNSTYFESVLNVKIPTMTSNTTPSGTASCTNSYGAGFEAYKAFDGDESTAPLSTENASVPWQVAYTFGSQYTPYAIKVISRSQYNYTSTIKIELQNTSDNWVEIGTINRTSTSGTKTDTFIVTSPFKAKAIRARYTAVSNKMYGEYIQEMQAYGRA